MSKTQITYDGIKKEDYSEEVLQKYSFPSDKDHLLRIMRGERTWSREFLKNQYQQASQDAALSTLALSAGGLAFAFYLTPAGKVLRDRYIASMSPARRFFRAAVPFFGVVFPVYIVRQRLDEGNGYVN